MYHPFHRTLSNVVLVFPSSIILCKSCLMLTIAQVPERSSKNNAWTLMFICRASTRNYIVCAFAQGNVLWTEVVCVAVRGCIICHSSVATLRSMSESSSPARGLSHVSCTNSLLPVNLVKTKVGIPRVHARRIEGFGEFGVSKKFSDPRTFSEPIHTIRAR